MNLNPSHNWGHNMAYGEEYYQNAVQLLRNIRGDAEILAVLPRLQMHSAPVVRSMPI